MSNPRKPTLSKHVARGALLLARHPHFKFRLEIRCDSPSAPVTVFTSPEDVLAVSRLERYLNAYLEYLAECESRKPQPATAEDHTGDLSFPVAPVSAPSPAPTSDSVKQTDSGSVT